MLGRFQRSQTRDVRGNIQIFTATEAVGESTRTLGHDRDARAHPYRNDAHPAGKAQDVGARCDPARESRQAS